MHDFFRYLRDHDGVATSATAREFGITWHKERRLIDLGVLNKPSHRVLRSMAFPETWRQRCRLATMGPGNGVISHASAVRLHGLDGCEDDERVHLLCRKGSWPGAPGEIVTHFTRGLSDDDIVDINGIPVLSVPSTLALLRAHATETATATALISALRGGWSVTEIRTVAYRWQTRGRPGPSFIIDALQRAARQTKSRDYASTGASISSAADQGSRRCSTTSPVTSSHRSPVQI
jgi:hypothetical protein